MSNDEPRKYNNNIPPFVDGYLQAINDMTDNLIRNGQLEAVDNVISLVVTDEKIKLIAKEMENNILKNI
jgi:hypothetical protein